MAKLYAELTSDKGGRVASKGGDSSIKVSLNHSNKNYGILDTYIINNTLKVFYNNSLIEEIQLKS